MGCQQADSASITPTKAIGYISFVFGKCWRPPRVWPSTASPVNCLDGAMSENCCASLECARFDRAPPRRPAEGWLAVFEFTEGWYNARLVYPCPGEHSSPQLKQAMAFGRFQVAPNADPCRAARAFFSFFKSKERCMSVLDDKSIFVAMKQDGPFAVEDDVYIRRNFSSHAREWIRAYFHQPLTVMKYRAVRGQIFDLLQIEHFSDIQPLIDDPSLFRDRSDRAYALLGTLFGINGGVHEVRNRIRQYAVAADGVIDYLKNKVLEDYSSHIELSNEIEAMQSPVNLLLTACNNRYHKKARFEAKRKLVLMGLAGSIDQRERETEIEHKFATFLNFLNENVWSPRLKIGELRSAYLLSRHDKDDFACVDVTVLEEGAAMQLEKLNECEKLTLIKRRLFEDGRSLIPVYVTVRKKDSAAKILKLLRKNEKNPAVAVDDELGLMAVLDSINDVKRFVRHLTDAAVKAESFMVLEDISDTLTGGFYHGTSESSSQQTPMLKFFARLGGMRVEFIIHTNQTYLNYRYQRDIAHDEYEVRRLFDSGVAEFLFPPDIYHLDMDKIRNRQLRKFRKAIEQTVQ